MAEETKSSATPWLAFLVGALVVAVVAIGAMVWSGQGPDQVASLPEQVDMNVNLPEAPDVDVTVPEVNLPEAPKPAQP